MNIISTLVQGDSATWLDDPVLLADGRSASSQGGWALKYVLRGPSQADLAATASGTSWATVLTAAASAALQPGTYAWAAAVSKGTERFTVGSGQLTITQDIAQVNTAYDTRTAAQIALANCEAAMATFNATGGKVKKYEIAGRTMEFQTIADLMALHSFWKVKVKAEQTSDLIAQGLGNPSMLFVRLRRP